MPLSANRDRGQSAANRETGREKEVARPLRAGNSAWGRCNYAARVTVSWVNALESGAETPLPLVNSRIGVVFSGLARFTDSYTLLVSSRVSYLIQSRVDRRQLMSIGYDIAGRYLIYSRMFTLWKNMENLIFSEIFLDLKKSGILLEFYWDSQGVLKKKFCLLLYCKQSTIHWLAKFWIVLRCSLLQSICFVFSIELMNCCWN